MDIATPEGVPQVKQEAQQTSGAPADATDVVTDSVASYPFTQAVFVQQAASAPPAGAAEHDSSNPALSAALPESCQHAVDVNEAGLAGVTGSFQSVIALPAFGAAAALGDNHGSSAELGQAAISDFSQALLSQSGQAVQFAALGDMMQPIAFNELGQPITLTDLGQAGAGFANLIIDPSQVGDGKSGLVSFPMLGSGHTAMGYLPNLPAGAIPIIQYPIAQGLPGQLGQAVAISDGAAGQQILLNGQQIFAQMPAWNPMMLATPNGLALPQQLFTTLGGGLILQPDGTLQQMALPSSPAQLQIIAAMGSQAFVQGTELQQPLQLDLQSQLPPVAPLTTLTAQDLHALLGAGLQGALGGGDAAAGELTLQAQLPPAPPLNTACPTTSEAVDDQQGSLRKRRADGDAASTPGHKRRAVKNKQIPQPQQITKLLQAIGGPLVLSAEGVPVQGASDDSHVAGTGLEAQLDADGNLVLVPRQSKVGLKAGWAFKTGLCLIVCQTYLSPGWSCFGH